MSAGEQARAAELRAAWYDGAKYDRTDVCDMRLWSAHVAAEAARRYPDPATPRVEGDYQNVQWRYLPSDTIGERGTLEYWRDGYWNDIDGDHGTRFAHTPGRVELWYSLQSKPFIRDGVPCATAAGPEAGR